MKKRVVVLMTIAAIGAMAQTAAPQPAAQQPPAPAGRGADRAARQTSWRVPARAELPANSAAAQTSAVPTLISPISSRKMVPLSACSNLPRWRPAAPVNDPFS